MIRTNNIHDLLSKWKSKRALCYIITIALMIIGAGMAWYYSIAPSILSVALLSLGIGGLVAHWRKYAPKIQDLAQVINDQNPNLEYSSSLLYEEPSNFLEELQQAKVSEQLMTKDYSLKLPIRFCVAVGIGTLSLLILSGILFHQFDTHHGVVDQTMQALGDSVNTEKAPDSISLVSLDVSISPPSYTSLSRQRVQSRDLEIPEGTVVQWDLSLSQQAELSYLLFSNGDTIPMLKDRYSRSFSQSDNYRYGFNFGSQHYVSDYHAIQVNKDQAATVAITGIEEYTRLNWKANHDIPINIELADDYGLKSTTLIATIAKGQGESVKFREKEIAIKGFRSGAKNFIGSHQFSTRRLEMEPGDELYFYVLAKDNCPYRDQVTKSPTYFVAIEDTTSYDYVDDASMQVDLMPDFFRSQRQIIIDSEHLLSIRNSISRDSFNRMSNELGYDQKMLRLKYGQFMGEESESGIAIENEIDIDEEENDHDHDHEGHDHDHDHDNNAILSKAREVLGDFMHDHDHEAEEGQLMATKGTEKEEAVRPSWVKELSHTHDNEEEATFHDVSIKSKLRAAMSEMWDAELYLRLYKPESSLPYQYRSLKLLQEIKNHARIYVHRIGFDPPVIKEQEKRLSGDLDEIIDSKLTQVNERTDPYDLLTTLAKTIESSENLDFHLEQIQAVLSELAIDRPEILPLLSSLQSLDTPTMHELNDLKKNLLKVIPFETDQANTSPVSSHSLSVKVAKAIESK